VAGRRARRSARVATAAPADAGPSGGPVSAPVIETPVLPAGRIPTVGMREIVAALHRRRSRRREAVNELAHALGQLAGGVERHLERIAQLKDAVEAQGGNLESLRYYDNVMARLRNELRSAERALAEAFHTAAEGGGPPSTR